MATEVLVLQEYEPLYHLLNAVPNRCQRGLFSSDIDWTCFDATDEVFVVGTSVGSLFVYDRIEKTVKHSLSAKQDRTDAITKVKIIQRIDTMIAVGRSSGIVSIFQLLTSETSDSYEEVRVFQILDIHRSSSTALEWSQNAMKLFSGDANGVVACTEINYSSNSSQSFVILKETSAGGRIVQLSYHQHRLLVSSFERSFIVHCDEDNKIIQIGKSQRKRSGAFGAVFLLDSGNAEDVAIFATRPGLRLWKASADGCVRLTYLLQDDVTHESLNVKPLGSTLLSAAAVQDHCHQFGPLFVFRCSLLLTFDERGIYVFDPEARKLVCYHTNLGEIVDVAVNGGEVFVLRKSARQFLIRLADGPSSSESLSAKDVASVKGLTRPGLEGPQAVIKLGQRAAKATEDLAAKIIGEVGQKLHTVPKIASKNIPVWVHSKIKTHQVKRDEGQRSHETHANPSPSDSRHTTGTFVVDRESEAGGGGGGGAVSDSSSSVVDQSADDDDDDEISPNSSEAVSSTADQSESETRFSQEQTTFESDFNLKEKSSASKGIDVDAEVSRTTSLSDLELIDDRSLETKDFTSAKDVSFNINGGEIVYSSIRKALRRRSSGRQKSSSTDIQNRTEFTDSSSCIPADSLPAKDSLSDLVDASTDCSGDDEAVFPEKTPSDESNAVHDIGHDFDIDLHLLRDSKPILDLISLNLEDTTPDETSVNVRTDNEMKASESDVLVVESNEPETEVYSVVEDPNRTSSLLDSSTEFDIYLTSEKSLSKLGFTVGNTEAPCNGNSVFLEEDLPPEVSNVTAADPTDESDYVSANILSLSSSLSQSEDTSDRLCDNGLTEWQAVSAPSSRLLSVSVSRSHVWCTDDRLRIHFACLDGQIQWQWNVVEKVSARQVATSPDGKIVWFVRSDGAAFAAAGVSSLRPFGVNWVETAKNVAHVAVDNGEAWFVRTTGEVAMQKDLSIDRPCSPTIHVPCSFKMKQISCRAHVICGMTSNNSVIIRKGVTKLKEEGSEWLCFRWSEVEMVISGLVVGDNGVLWVVDVFGGLWYSPDFAFRNPDSEPVWWQVSLDASKTFESGVWQRGNSRGTFEGNRFTRNQVLGECDLICSSSRGFWTFSSLRSALLFCPGPVIGRQWQQMDIGNLNGHKEWKMISATGEKRVKSGLIWLVDSFGQMFCFVPSSSSSSSKRLNLISVDPPEPQRARCRALAASVGSAWCLLSNGHVYIRRQMAGRCLPGYGWDRVDMAQIGDGMFVHVSIGRNSVWAVHGNGSVYLRIGVNHRPKGQMLSPAWLKLDDHYAASDLDKVEFKRVLASQNDSMVWGIDVRRRVYVRTGVSEMFPIGLKWKLVEGPPVHCLCMSRSNVYATTLGHQLIQRIGITNGKAEGESWKTLPGSFHIISVTANDELWAVDEDGDLHHQQLHCLHYNSYPVTLNSTV